MNGDRNVAAKMTFIILNLMTDRYELCAYFETIEFLFIRSLRKQQLPFMKNVSVESFDIVSSYVARYT